MVQAVVLNRSAAVLGSVRKRGSGNVELAAAPAPAVKVGGAGPKEPLTVAVPIAAPVFCTQTRKSRFSMADGLVASTSQDAVAVPFVTCSCTAGMPSSVFVGVNGAKGKASFWTRRATDPVVTAAGVPLE